MKARVDWGIVINGRVICIVGRMRPRLGTCPAEGFSRCTSRDPHESLDGNGTVTASLASPYKSTGWLLHVLIPSFRLTSFKPSNSAVAQLLRHYIYCRSPSPKTLLTQWKFDTIKLALAIHLALPSNRLSACLGQANRQKQHSPIEELHDGLAS
ncbi:hypothetical protein ZIOFF_072121 [Zingiber officinale]|uniref:Uncharacterized protein n=1 Tax=Zingiber officinale TaxID=94328 RepID=A0A8J5C4Q1_ZINOF|nr:hypothetical protein ZIOFF_072121 [Zingiber officinale]